MRPRLKSILKAVLGGIVGRAILSSLNALLLVLMGLQRFLAACYGKLWPALGLGYYDQRYVWAGGPRQWRWAERGTFAYRSIRPGATILDLCCGDGIYPGLFLRELNGDIDAVDQDASTIRMARRRYGGPGVCFHVADVVNDPFPRESYDAVTCFASLQYFDQAQHARLLAKIASALASRAGVFVGSVPIFTPPRRPDAFALRNFASEDDVRAFLSGHFANIETWCSHWAPGLTHCYFKCGAKNPSNPARL